MTKKKVVGASNPNPGQHSQAKLQELPKGFTKVSKDSLPEVKSQGPVASSSKQLNLLLDDDSQIVGVYQRWDRDMNAPHIQEKEGEGFFYSLVDGSKLSNVVGFQLIH